MAGARERQKAQREARILKAAEALFVRRGFAATGMQEIAIRAKLAVGTLYNYFPSKSRILRAIIERDTAEALLAGEEVIKRPPSDPVVAVQALLARAGAPYERHDRVLWRDAMCAALSDPEIGSGILGSDFRVIGLLASLLRELATRGQLRPELDEGRAAIALYSAFITWFLAYVTDDAVALDDVRNELDASVALVMHGLLAPARG